MFYIAISAYYHETSIILTDNIINVKPKRKIRLFLAIEPRIDVIKDFSVSLIIISFSEEKILNSEGKRRKVTIKDTINPNVIINPKSIIGLIPLNIRDRNAKIVDKTV